MLVSSKSGSAYLKGEDIKGMEVPVIVQRAYWCEEEGSNSLPINKFCLMFVGKSKGLLLNATNRDAMVEKYGDEINDWAGKELTLFTISVPYEGKTWAGIRLRFPGETVPMGEGPDF